jgi:hypothetical protein
VEKYVTCSRRPVQARWLGTAAVYESLKTVWQPFKNNQVTHTCLIGVLQRTQSMSCNKHYKQLMISCSFSLDTEEGVLHFV